MTTAIGEFANPHALAQHARKLARGAAATMAVSDRSRADDAVRRESVDIDDERARIVKPLGDGTVEDAADCRDAMRMAVREYARQTSLETKHKQGAVTTGQLAVFEVMLTDDEGYDISSGTVDLAISQYHQKSGKCPGTVQAAKKRLKALGVIELVNRTVHSGRAKLFGVPQRLQIATLIYFTPERMIAPLKALYEQFLSQLRMARAQREARRKAKGEDVQRRPLERRERRQKRVPALMNPRGWQRILACERKAQGEADADYAAREAKSLAWSTAWAAEQAASRDVTLE